MSKSASKGHPAGLYVLFGIEMWERFNYYGMRAILIYFMTDALMYAKPFASVLYGGYTSLIYLTPLIGGFFADRYWGNKRSIVFGGIVMAIAELVLFVCASTYHSSPQLSTLLFYIGLGGMIAGNGFFKPNISSMVGQLYYPGDRRSDSAYTIFYMGINVGGMLGPFICGLVGNTGDPADFKWGFLAGSIAMVLSVITLKVFQKKYIVSPENKPVGDTPEHMINKPSPLQNRLSLPVIVGLFALIAVAMGLLYLHAKDILSIYWLLLVSLIIILYVIFSDKTLTKIERDRVIAIFVVSFFVVFFWSAYEQTGASLAYFAAEQTNLRIEAINKSIPPSWFQSINSFFILLFAPLFAWMWLKLGSRKLEPSSPAKMAIGLFLVAAGYLWIAYGVKDVPPNVKVSMMWLTVMYALHTWGELCLSPIGLSLVNKLAPIKFASLLMAVWFMANAAANVFMGELSALYPPGPAEFKKAADAGIDLKPILDKQVTLTPELTEKLANLEIPAKYSSFLGFQIHTLYDFFMLFVVMSAIASLVLFVLVKWLLRKMHGMR